MTRVANPISFGEMQIHVTTLLGKKFDVEIDESGTLRDLKCKVEDMEWIHSDWQRFVFDRIELVDDDGLVVDQVNEIIRRHEGEPIGGDSCISLWLILRLKGGGNIIYHSPARTDQGSFSSSDSETDDGSPISHVSNGADTNGPEQDTSETRVKGLPDTLKPSQENGIRKDSYASNASHETGHSFWMFFSNAWISMNVALLMIAGAVFLVPKAMREIPQISRMLQSKVEKHDAIQRILKTVSDAVVEHGRSFALSATLLVVATALLFLAIRCCRRSPTLQSSKREKQNLYLEVLRDGERVKLSVSNIVVGDIVLSELKGKL